MTRCHLSARSGWLVAALWLMPLSVAADLTEAESVLAAPGQPVSRGESLAIIEDIDFRQGDSGEGLITALLSEADVNISVAAEDGGIRVEFEDTTLAGDMQPGFDAEMPGAAVMRVAVRVDALPKDRKTVMLVQPTEEYDYLVYQAGKHFTLEVRPQVTAGYLASVAQTPGYSGEKLSLNFQDIEVRSVLQLIADFTDLNLVASDTVQGRITLRLKQVPWDQALDIILKTRGLDKRLLGNTLVIAPAGELQAREQLELESRKQMFGLKPLRTEFIEVKYADAAGIFALFQNSGGEGVISPRGSVIVDERTNSIILTETADRIEEFRQMLARLDIPVRQVLIEARIVTATSNFGKSLGVRWGTLGGNGSGDKLTQFGGSLTTLGEIRRNVQEGNAPTSTSDDNLVIDLGVGGSASAFALGLVSDDFLLELELSALETEGHGEVIARPKVITADKHPAFIVSGDQIPYQEASSSGATSTRFVDAVLGLNVTPRIMPDDRIIMDLEVHQDSIGAIYNGIPSIRTNSIQTRVLVKDGETIVLGGVFQTVTSEGVTRTPLLGDLPFLGRLFRRTTRSDDKQELLIFITPRLVRDAPG